MTAPGCLGFIALPALLLLPTLLLHGATTGSGGVLRNLHVHPVNPWIIVTTLARFLSFASLDITRFLATDEFLWVSDVAAILRERLGERAAKVPTRVAPNVLVRGMSLFDGSLRSIVGDLGKTAYYSNAKARERLGWQPRPVADSIADTGESLLAHPGK